MQTQTHFVFIDTQTLIYAFEKNYLSAKQLVAEHLEKLNHRLISTHHQLIELSYSENWLSTHRILEQMLEHKPYWAYPFTTIQKAEIINFIYRQQGKDVSESLAFTPSFDESFADDDSNLLLNPVDFTWHLWRGLNTQLRKSQEIHANVLNLLSIANKKGMYGQEEDRQAIRSSIQHLLSDAIPSEFSPPFSNISDLVDHCMKRKSQLINQCPSFGAEYHLSNYRTSSPKRKARISDSPDLFHAIQAFPYTSTFITSDGFLANGLENIKTKLPNLKAKLIRAVLRNPKERDCNFE